MAWRLSPVTEPSWARTTCTQEALGTDQIRMVASGEAENTKSYVGTAPGRFTQGKLTSPRAPGGRFHQRKVLISRSEASWKGGKSQTHLGRVEDDAGDFLGVALERGQDLLRALVEHDDVFVSSTWRTEWESLGWECGANQLQTHLPRVPLSPFKFPKNQGKRPIPRWETARRAPLPVRILLVSEGHRSKARIPGMLALCSPCAREESPKSMPQTAKLSQK